MSDILFLYRPNTIKAIIIADQGGEVFPFFYKPTLFLILTLALENFGKNNFFEGCSGIVIGNLRCC